MVRAAHLRIDKAAANRFIKNTISAQQLRIDERARENEQARLVQPPSLATPDPATRLLAELPNTATRFKTLLSTISDLDAKASSVAHIIKSRDKSSDEESDEEDGVLVVHQTPDDGELRDHLSEANDQAISSTNRNKRAKFDPFEGELPFALGSHPIHSNYPLHRV